MLVWLSFDLGCGRGNCRPSALENEKEESAELEPAAVEKSQSVEGGKVAPGRPCVPVSRDDQALQGVQEGRKLTYSVVGVG